MHRFGSARSSAPNRLIGTTVTVLVDERDRVLRVIEPITGEVQAEHTLVALGEASVVDAHDHRPRRVGMPVAAPTSKISSSRWGRSPSSS